MALFFSDYDHELLRPSIGRDPLGLQPIWTTRARDLVPHLTAQSSRLEGFQVLLTIFGLWPEFQRRYKAKDGQIRNFYVLMEQAIARCAYAVNEHWPLPGRRRLKGGQKDLVISLDRDFHLAYGQLASGTWIIYRGAAERAGLLDLETHRVTEIIAAKMERVLEARAREHLFKAVGEAMASPKKVVPLRGGKSGLLATALAKMIAKPPLETVLLEPLMQPAGRPLTAALTTRLAELDSWQHHSLLSQFSDQLPDYRKTFEQLVRCERWLAPLEASFEWLCANSGLPLSEAAYALPVDLDALRGAQVAFRDSGPYEGTGQKRQALYAELDLASKASFIASLLETHRQISEARSAGPWVLLNEGNRLEVRVPMEAPNKGELHPATAWRNDYYLTALWRLSRQIIKGVHDDA